jgi:hypothetical protein
MWISHYPMPLTEDITKRLFNHLRVNNNYQLSYTSNEMKGKGCEYLHKLTECIRLQIRTLFIESFEVCIIRESEEDV